MQWMSTSLASTGVAENDFPIIPPASPIPGWDDDDDVVVVVVVVIIVVVVVVVAQTTRGGGPSSLKFVRNGGGRGQQTLTSIHSV